MRLGRCNNCHILFCFLYANIIHCISLFGFIRPWSIFPHYVNLDERCAFVIYGGAYINRKCSIKEGYICEKPVYGFMGKTSYLLFSLFLISSRQHEIYTKNNTLLVSIYLDKYIVLFSFHRAEQLLNLNNSKMPFTIESAHRYCICEVSDTPCKIQMKT